MGLAAAYRARLVLIHVVDAPAVLLQGEDSGGLHAREDRAYLDALVDRLRALDLAVESALRFGRPADELVKAVEERNVELLVLGSHGHRGLDDLVRGETVAPVRHRVKVPVLIVPAPDTEPPLHRPEP